jgi:hypothetical protein
MKNLFRICLVVVLLRRLSLYYHLGSERSRRLPIVRMRMRKKVALLETTAGSRVMTPIFWPKKRQNRCHKRSQNRDGKKKKQNKVQKLDHEYDT